MTEEKISPAHRDIRLAFDVTPQEISERIRDSRIANEPPDRTFGIITAIHIGEGLGSIDYASTSKELLIELPDSQNHTTPLGLSMDRTAVVLGEEDVQFVTRLEKDESRNMDDRIVSVIVGAGRISYEVFTGDDFDEQTKQALDFLAKNPPKS